MGAWVEEKKNAFHRDFHLPDWLDGVERETELALKRRIVRGQSTEDLEQKKGNHSRPVSQITRLPGKGAVAELPFRAGREC